MANERRVRYNFVAGGLSVALASGDTTLQSNGLQDLPALLTDEYCMACLFTVDVVGRVTKKEIVKITAHSAGAGSATMVRAQLGTTAQAWSVGDRWSVTDLADDNLVICTTATRPSAPYEGLEIYDRTTLMKHWWNGSNWILDKNLKMYGVGPTIVGSAPAIDTGSVPFKIQAGTTVAVTNAGGGTGPINWPVAFPNGVICAMAVNGDAGASDQVVCGMYNVNANNFEIIATNVSSHGRFASATLRFNWIAIGW